MQREKMSTLAGRTQVLGRYIFPFASTLLATHMLEEVTTGRIFRAVSRHGTPRGKESQRVLSGTLSEGALIGCNWSISLR
jgi:hypothetical protein